MRLFEKVSRTCTWSMLYFFTFLTISWARSHIFLIGKKFLNVFLKARQLLLRSYFAQKKPSCPKSTFSIFWHIKNGINTERILLLFCLYSLFKFWHLLVKISLSECREMSQTLQPEKSKFSKVIKTHQKQYFSERFCYFKWKFRAIWVNLGKLWIFENLLKLKVLKSSKIVNCSV